jgi:hypothetical protein
MKYLQDGDKEAKDKMIYHTCLAGVGIIGLFVIGITGLIESSR